MLFDCRSGKSQIPTGVKRLESVDSPFVGVNLVKALVKELPPCKLHDILRQKHPVSPKRFAWGRRFNRIQIMPTSTILSVKSLSLDLKNFRTIPQQNEIAAVTAMISIAPDRFWALSESLLDGGYLPTENIIVLKTGKKKIVKEGNRRIAALKLILGLVDSKSISFPNGIEEKIKNVTAQWKKENGVVPCAFYEPEEESVVDRIVTLTHGKGEKAGRDDWTSVARARHNRDKSKQSEPGLDLLEKYLAHGKNQTGNQAERWSGDFPLSVLDEALKVALRLGFSGPRDLVDNYPATKHKTTVDAIVFDIGVKAINFEKLRDKISDWAVSYGVAPLVQPMPVAPGASSVAVPTTANSAIGASPATSGTVITPQSPAKKTAAVSLTNPKSVRRTLRKFVPKGAGREKIVTLLEEARTLNMNSHPLSFCFVLRSMFELSAKAFAADHKKGGFPPMTKTDGSDKKLEDALRDVTTYLTKNQTDKAMQKTLHGAITELAKKDGFLSVTSMNQLVHNPKFSVNETHICTLFHNVFPLLEQMNS